MEYIAGIGSFLEECARHLFSFLARLGSLHITTLIELAPNLRHITIESVLFRLLLAIIFGGVIGLERGRKKRPAGFRTHMVVCLGATLTIILGQYELYMLENQWLSSANAIGAKTDITRFAAQVVNGVGFLGAGTIIVTKQQRVKGLTTAAGLWVSAIVGLTLGAGFFEGGLLVTFLVLSAELLFVKLEYKLLNNARERIYYIEYFGKDCLEAILGLFKGNDIRVLNMEITRAEESEDHNASAIFYTQIGKHKELINIESLLNSIHGLHLVEEL